MRIFALFKRTSRRKRFIATEFPPRESIIAWLFFPTRAKDANDVFFASWGKRSDVLKLLVLAFATDDDKRELARKGDADAMNAIFSCVRTLRDFYLKVRRMRWKCVLCVKICSGWLTFFFAMQILCCINKKMACLVYVYFLSLLSLLSQSASSDPSSFFSDQSMRAVTLATHHEKRLGIFFLFLFIFSSRACARASFFLNYGSFFVFFTWSTSRRTNRRRRRRLSNRRL